ncbi:unnamed protein product [Lampetra planeri]
MRGQATEAHVISPRLDYPGDKSVVSNSSGARGSPGRAVGREPRADWDDKRSARNSVEEIIDTSSEALRNTGLPRLQLGSLLSSMRLEVLHVTGSIYIKSLPDAHRDTDEAEQMN